MNLLKSKKKSAFTLIEILVVVVILAIIAGATMPAFLGYANNRSLSRTAQLFLSDISLVRNKSLSGAVHTDPAESGNWTMRINCGTANYNLGVTSNLGAFSSVETKTLPNRYTFCTSTSGSIDLIFERLSGNLVVTDGSGRIPFTIVYRRGESGSEKSVPFTVYQNGKVDIQYP